MYPIEFPNYSLEDFFDEMIASKQGTAYNFLKGRLTLIKNQLIEKENEYVELTSSKSDSGLYDIEENTKILISDKESIGNIMKLSKNISQEELINLLNEKKLSSIFQETKLDEMSLVEIKSTLNNTSIKEALNLITDSNLKNILSYIDSEAMKKVYEKYLVNTKESQNIGRKVYEHVMLLSENNLCPYCLQGTVSTVDHYLPKAYFIEYAITPINLLPCCFDCNKNKKDTRLLQEDKMFINPYFDNLKDTRWLGCKVNEHWPITFTYYVREDIEDDILKERLKTHFRNLKLGSLYASNAVTYFRGRIKEIVNEYNSNDLKPPIESLRSSKESIEDYNLNSWEAKIYEALLNSNWFLEIAIEELQEKYKVTREYKVKNELYERWHG
ncbi:MAG: HNH endonuclease signature motif containing protein [Carnobacterium sp.]|uniref:HNH endonuclease signature motif containing protein n=1 Tax=Carnobacterium sp. TaxID=48221 RepID=UPI0033152FBD